MIYTYLNTLVDYGDIHYKGYLTTGGTTPDGQPFFLQQEDAINNALKLYLLSKKGDYGRYVSKGGPLFEILNSPADLNTQAKIKEVIIKSLAIYSNIQVQDVIVTTDVTGEKWKIKVQYIDLYHKMTSSTSITLVQRT